jgi:hypothetical protein
MQIMRRKWLIKAVLKGKNIFGTRPLNHTQKKENYDCFEADKNKYELVKILDGYRWFVKLLA